MMESDIEKLVDLAVVGEKKTLENLVRCVQDRVYRLALLLQ